MLVVDGAGFVLILQRNNILWYQLGHRGNAQRRSCGAFLFNGVILYQCAIVCYKLRICCLGVALGLEARELLLLFLALHGYDAENNIIDFAVLFGLALLEGVFCRTDIIFFHRVLR